MVPSCCTVAVTTGLVPTPISMVALVAVALVIVLVHVLLLATNRNARLNDDDLPPPTQR